ncbi:MAG: class I SAM-dependent methyltransferase [Candidatus Pacebacteria bacterium]|nr:class I SAM-dependent methyltransferase [Candidatus Paceibacterota bacterium]
MEKFSESIEARFTARHQKAIDLCGRVRGYRILNTGCYNGWFEQAMLKKGAREVVGIDVNQAFVKMARKAVTQAKFLKMSALKLNFPSDRFDLVTILDVTEHLPKNQGKACFQEIKRVLKPGGRVLISVPSYRLGTDFLDPAWYFGHRHYSSKQLKEKVNQVGLRVLKTETKGSVWEILSLNLLYFFKHFLRTEVPFKNFLEKKRQEEYQETEEGLVTLYLLAGKD